MVLIDPNGDQLKYMVHLEFKATNNMAEYEALIFGLTQALSLGVRQLPPDTSAIEDPGDLIEPLPPAQGGPDAWISEIRDYLKRQYPS